MKFRSQCAICLVAGVGFFAACGDDDSEPAAGTGGVGGGTGGATGGAGGAKASGGSTSSGGKAASGGAGGGPSSGGAGNGGTASSGGASSGGAASGGASSGGASSGGASSGGAPADAGPDGSGEPDAGGPIVVINEIESNNGDPEDWVELFNRGSSPADISGWVLRDSADTGTGYVFPANTTIAAGAYFVVEREAFSFGLGDGDSVRLFNGSTTVDSHAYAAHASGTNATWQRCPNGTGDFVTATQTKGARNTCPQ